MCENDKKNLNLLAAVERLKDTWRDRANYVENLAGYDDDVIAELNKAHAKIIRICISELCQEIEAALNIKIYA